MLVVGDVELVAAGDVVRDVGVVYYGQRYSYTSNKYNL
jgi:hypothetical protein